VAEEKTKPGRYSIITGKKPAGRPKSEPKKEAEGELAQALKEYIRGSLPPAPSSDVHERPTLPPPAKSVHERPTSPPKKKTEPLFEDTLTGMPIPTRPEGQTLFDELFGHVPVEIIGYRQRSGPVATELSDTEKRLITGRIKDAALAKQLTSPLNASAAKRLVEAIRWETRMVEKLEQQGFPRGVPEPHFFLPHGGPARGKISFTDRFLALEALAWEDSRKRMWRDPRELRKMRDEGLARIILHRVGEDAVKAFHALPRHVKEEVLESVKRYEELRHSLHEKGFDKSLPITNGLSESLDVLPTPLSEHLPELDRQLETLYKMKRLPQEELHRYAAYARRVVGGRE